MEVRMIEITVHETTHEQMPPRKRLQLTRLVMVTILMCCFTMSLPSSVSALPANLLAITVTNVSPNQGYDYLPTTITIVGTEFVATPTAQLNNIPLTNVTFVNSTMLTATVPADLPIGEYTVKVTNPDNQSASIASAFTVFPSGDGTITPWRLTSNMTTPREGLAVVTWQNHLYALSGNTVEYATALEDGSLSSWQLTSTMNESHNYFSAVAYNGFLYALGSGCGYLPEMCNEKLTVEYTSINTDGSLGDWQYTTSLITLRGGYGGGAVVIDDYVYILGGKSSKNVDRAYIDSDGTLSSWETVGLTLELRDGVAVISVGRYIYAIGGWDIRSVERAEVNADGILSDWQPVSSMANRRATFEVMTLGGYIYASGGWGGGVSGVIAPIDSVERVVVYQDGSLGNWQTINPLTKIKRCLASTAVAGKLYILGGGNNNDVYSEVEVAEFSPPTISSVLPTSASVMQPTQITITGSNFLPYPSLRLGTNISLTTAYVSTTTLTTVVLSGLPPGLYSLTVINPNSPAATLANAIRIDDVGPVANSLIINNGALNTPTVNVTVGLFATDTTDNPADLSMQLSNDGNTWSDWQPYASLVSWTLKNEDGIKTVYGQFKDPAGNISSIIFDTIGLDTTAPADYGLTINNGALFSNQISVMLTIGAQPGTAQMQISNDGGFAGALWEPFTSHKAWTITQYGKEEIPRLVYIRYKDYLGNTSATYSDDIILDVTPPKGSVSIAPNISGTRESVSHPTHQAGVSSTEMFTIYLPLIFKPLQVKLLLTATDDVSGVGGMIISNYSDFSGAAWEAFAAQKNWGLMGNTVYVKYRDNAGNESEVYSAIYIP
jgi:hypothetical protein